MILVTGATGSVGPQIIATLRQLGHKVRILSRHPPSNITGLDDVEVRIGDVTNPGMVKSAVQGAEYVIHMAALLHIENPTALLEEQHRRINVDGTATVVEEARKANVKRIVFFSSFNVYGTSDGQVVNEFTVPHPDTLYGQTKLDAERIVLSVKNYSDQPIGVVLRVAPVYGPRIKGNYKQLLMALAQKRFIPVGSGKNRRTVVYIKDVAKAVALTMTHPAAAGQIFNITDGTFHDMREIVSTICAALDRTEPHFSFPARPVRMAVGAVEHVANLLHFKSPILRSAIDKYLEDIAVDGRLIQLQLGFLPQYDLITGWRETIKEMKENGDI